MSPTLRGKLRPKAEGRKVMARLAHQRGVGEAMTNVIPRGTVAGVFQRRRDLRESLTAPTVTRHADRFVYRIEGTKTPYCEFRMCAAFGGSTESQGRPANPPC